DRDAVALYFTASAPALATCPSCEDSAPETPIAPTILPSAILERRPRTAQHPSGQVEFAVAAWSRPALRPRIVGRLGAGQPSFASTLRRGGVAPIAVIGLMASHGIRDPPWTPVTSAA